MAAKQFPIDLKVLRVIAHRYKWMLVTLTFVSFAFSAVIAKSTVNLYSATVMMFVDPENVLADIAKGVAVSTSLKDQLSMLKHLISSDDFIQPYVIQELNLRLADVYVPPGKLVFMPRLIDAAEHLRDTVKRIFGLEVYTTTPEQKQLLQNQELSVIVKDNIHLLESKSTLLTISYTGPNPTACRRIVDILANQCKEQLLRTKNTETREAQRYIERQFNEANEKLEDLERNLTKMQVENFDKGPEARISLLQQRQDAEDALRVIRKDVEELRQSRASLLDQQTKRRESLLNDPEMIEKLFKQTQTLDAKLLDEKRMRLAQLQTTYTDDWPEIIQLKAQLIALENKVAATVQNANDTDRDKILLTDLTYAEYFGQIKQIDLGEKALTTKERNLLDNIDVYDAKLKAMPEIQQSFGSIQREIDLYGELQADLAVKLQTTKATMELEKSRGENRIKMLGRQYPTKPIGLSSIALMILICVIGPGIGSVIVFLVYYLNSSVKSPEDVRLEYNLPVLAVIPKTDFKKELQRHRRLLTLAQKTGDRRHIVGRIVARLPIIRRVIASFAHPETIRDDVLLPDIELTEIELFGKVLKQTVSPQQSSQNNEFSLVTLLTNPESLAAEEYRRLCFNVEWNLKESLSGPCKTIMVTSALPSEGKTLTALNLASTLARNHKVLLIDANFRKPAISHVFGISPQEVGLSDMLEQQATPSLFVPPHIPNLSMLLAGMALKHPADLLSSKQMHQFVESVKGSAYFEYAIFDVPPVSLLPDSSIIASKVDGIVWVIWELGTDKEVVRLSLTRILNPALLGVVLNHSEQRVLPAKYNKIWKGYQPTNSQKRKMA